MMFRHEMIHCFASVGLRLCPTLESMLGEDSSHQTERRGSGYTQATRYLASFINQPRHPLAVDDLDLFLDWRDKLDNHRLRHSVSNGAITTWRHWDPCPPLCSDEADGIGIQNNDVFEEASRQAELTRVPGMLVQEESELLARMILDIVLPRDNEPHYRLISWPKKLKVGSCPLAEKWFLELAHGFIPRKARCNFLVDRLGRPLLLEKTGMGDDHSCLSLEPLVLNGVRIPVGSLLAVEYGPEAFKQAMANETIPGHQIPIVSCRGFRMLRLTTLAVSGANRRRAFTTHFQSQVTEGLFEPETTEISQLQRLAEQAIATEKAS